MKGFWTAVGVGMVTIGFLLAPVPAWARGCTAAQANAAAAAADHLHSWPEVFALYKSYRDCDDGGVAEAQTEAVMRLFADQWDDLAVLARIVREHADFRLYVLRHVDSTADTKDLERARDQSAKHCPPSLHSLCKDIASAAKEALR